MSRQPIQIGPATARHMPVHSPPVPRRLPCSTLYSNPLAAACQPCVSKCVSNTSGAFLQYLESYSFGRCMSTRHYHICFEYLRNFSTAPLILLLSPPCVNHASVRVVTTDRNSGKSTRSGRHHRAISWPWHWQWMQPGWTRPAHCQEPPAQMHPRRPQRAGNQQPPTRR